MNYSLEKSNIIYDTAVHIKHTSNTFTSKFILYIGNLSNKLKYI